MGQQMQPAGLFKIGRRWIGARQPLFVIAEIGLNHDGDVDRALRLVDAAADAGADAVKLQTLRASDLVADDCPAPVHVAAASLRDLFARYELQEDAHQAVAARARARGLAFLSTPLYEDAVDLLERVDCDAYKIASGDLTHHPLIARAARTGKPLILSTGLSSLAEVRGALRCAERAGARAVALLHCVSAYPVPDGQENLGAIATLAREYACPVGWSDHGRHDAVALGVALALGTSIYERHIKLSPDDPVLDADVSSPPDEIAAIVATARRAHQVMGDGRREPQPAERANIVPSRRGLYATRDLAAGHVITADDIIALRPARGLPPEHWHTLVGTRVTRPIPAGAPFTAADLPAADPAPASVREPSAIGRQGAAHAQA